MQVLWLTSYYPNPYQPNNNEEIKFAAKSLSSLMLVDVIHVVQLGSNRRSKKGSIHDKEGNFREMIYSFNFRPWGIQFIDEIRYQIIYNTFCSKVLHNYIQEYGKPSIIHVQEPLLMGTVAKKVAFTWESGYFVSFYKQNFDQLNLHNANTLRRVSSIVKNAAAAFADDTTLVDKIMLLCKIKKVKQISHFKQTSDSIAQQYFEAYKTVA